MSKPWPGDGANAERMAAIFRMVSEIRRKNFSYRIQGHFHGDELDAVIGGLNILADELEATTNAGTMSSKVNFIVDAAYNIQVANPGVTRYLGYAADELENRPLISLLAAESAELWRATIVSLIETEKERHCSVMLTFVQKTGREMRVFSHLYWIMESEAEHARLWLIGTPRYSSIRIGENSRLQGALQRQEGTTGKSFFTISEYRQWAPFTNSDVKRMFQLRDHIIENLDAPLALNDLAFMVGMNKIKLQQVFRKIFATNVFTFVAHERLEQAKTYLLETNMPLKVIAYKIGYSQLRFARLFEKEVGMPPGEYRNTIQ